MGTVFSSRGIDHVDIIVARVQGDRMAFIRAMDWTVRVDIVFMVASTLVRDVLVNNEYVQAEWDVKRWCTSVSRCLNNEVFLRKGFNPLPALVQRQLVDHVGRR
jgi:hypothetical protein